MALFFLLLITGKSHAEQLRFNRFETSDTVKFFYQWRDHQQQTQSLQFTLKKERLFKRFRQFHQYKAEFAQKHIIKQLVDWCQQQLPAGISFQLREQVDGPTIELISDDKDKLAKAQQALMAKQQQLFEDYLNHIHYQRYQTPNGIESIKPFHTQIALASVPDLKPIKPIILKQVSIRNIRLVTNFVLSWIQSIPYATLDSRASSNGAGFSPPAQVIYENKGDCDSKATLMATLLRDLMPRIKIILVFLEKHTLIGIHIPPQDNDVTVTIDETTYVLAEPTGPALMPLGTIAPSSEQDILAGYFTAEVLP